MRVRAEEEQFLLSCTELETFVSWIEALSTAIGIALPIDQRTYPRYRTLPPRHSQPRIEVETEEAQREIAREFFPHLLEGEGSSSSGSSASSTTAAAAGSSSGASSSSSSVTRRLAASLNALRGVSPSSDDARQQNKQRNREERRRARSSVDVARAAVERDLMLGFQWGSTSNSTSDAHSRSSSSSNQRARSRGDNGGSSKPRASSPSPNALDRSTPNDTRGHRRRSSSAPSTTSSSSAATPASTSSTPPSSQDNSSPSSPISEDDTSDDATDNVTPEDGKRGQISSGRATMDPSETMDYARRCFRHLNEFSARRHDLVVKNGKLWRIEWETQTLRRCRVQ